MVKIWLFFGFITALMHIYETCMVGDKDGHKKEMSDPDVIAESFFYFASGLIGFGILLHKNGWTKKIRDFWNEVRETF